MSTQLDQSANFVLTSNVSGYTAGIAQAYQQTSLASKAMDGLLNSTEKLNSGMERGAKALKLGFYATLATTTVGAAKFESQLQSLQGVAATAGRSFEPTQNAVDNLRKSLPMATEQAVALSGALQKASVSSAALEKSAKTLANMSYATGENLSATSSGTIDLQRSLGQGGSQNLRQIAGSVTNVSNQLGTSASSMLQFAGGISPVARQVGLSQNDVIALSGAAARSGQDGFAAQSTLTSMLNTIDQAKRYNDQATLRKYADFMGTSVQGVQSNSGMQNIQGIMGAVVNNPNSTMAMEQLGYDGVRARKAIYGMAQSGNLDQAMAAANDPNAAANMDRGAEAAASGFNDSLQKVENTFDSLSNQIGTVFLPLATGGVEAFDKMAKGLTNLLKPITDMGKTPVGRWMAASTGTALGGAGMLAGGAGVVGTALFARQMISSPLTQGLRGGDKFAEQFAAGGGSTAQRFFQIMGRAVAGRDNDSAMYGGKASDGLLHAAGSVQHVSTTAQSKVRGALNWLSPGWEDVYGHVPANVRKGIGAKGIGARAKQALSLGLILPAMSSDYLLKQAGADYGDMESRRMMPGADGRTAVALRGLRGDESLGALLRTGLGTQVDTLKGTAQGLGSLIGWGAGVGREKSWDFDAGSKVHEIMQRHQFARQEMDLSGAGTLARVGQGLGTTGRLLGSAGATAGRGALGLAAGGVGLLGSAAGGLLGAAMSPLGMLAISGGSALYGAAKNQQAKNKELAEAPLHLDNTELGLDSLSEALRAAGKSADSFAERLNNIRFGRGSDTPTTEYDRFQSQNAEWTDAQLGDAIDKTPGGLTDDQLVKYAASQLAMAGDDTAMRNAFIKGDLLKATNNVDKNDEIVAKADEAVANGIDLSGLADPTQSRAAFLAQATLESKGIRSVIGSAPVDNAHDSAMRHASDLLGNLPGWDAPWWDDLGQAATLGAGFIGEVVSGGGASPYSLKMDPNASGYTERNNRLSEAAVDLGMSDDTSLSLLKAWQTYQDYGRVKISQDTLDAAAAAQGVDPSAFAGLADQLYKGSLDTSSARGEFYQLSPKMAELFDYIDTPDALRSQSKSSALVPSTSAETLPLQGTLAGNLLFGHAFGQMPGTSPDQAVNKELISRTSTDSQVKAEATQFVNSMRDAGASFNEIYSTVGAVASSLDTSQYSVDRFAEAVLSAAATVSTMDDAFSGRAFQPGYGITTARDNAQYSMAYLRMNGADPAAQEAAQGAVAAFEQQGTQLASDVYQRARQGRAQKLQEQFAREDMDPNREGSQAFIARRDFGKQRARADYEFNLQRARADEDKRRQDAWTLADFNKQRNRGEFEFYLQRDRAQEDYDRQNTRTLRDFNKQRARGEEDFQRSRKYAQEDFDKQIKRSAEQQAKAMFDVQNRLQARPTWSATGMLSNISDKLSHYKKQLENLKKLRALGLSSDTIKQFALNDPANAQQVERLLRDMQNDVSLVAEYNAASSEMIAIGMSFYTDVDNSAYANAVEDFAEQQRRAEEAFLLSNQRMDADYEESMRDRAEDFRRSMDQQLTDHKRMLNQSEEDFRESQNRQNIQYEQSLARQLADYNRQRAQQLADFDQSLRDREVQFEESLRRQRLQLTTELEVMDGDITTWAQEAANNLGVSVESLFGMSLEQMRGFKGELSILLDELTKLMEEKLNWEVAKNFGDVWAKAHVSPQGLVSGRKPDGYFEGGVLPGYTPGTDVHHFSSPTGGSLLLSGGEAIMRPEWTRAVGGEEAVKKMNADAKYGRFKQEFAEGGVFQNGRLPDSALSSVGGGHRMQHAAAAAFLRLNEAFKAAFGSSISITDSYRSYAAQVAVKKAKPFLAATPGYSNHGWGLALDLGSGINRQGTKQHSWMENHAANWGFWEPMHPGRSNKVEPWHWEYKNGVKGQNGGGGGGGSVSAAPAQPTEVKVDFTQVVDKLTQIGDRMGETPILSGRAPEMMERVRGGMGHKIQNWAKLAGVGSWELSDKQLSLSSKPEQLAAGAIFKKQTYMVGEAGNEILLPLNQRGAEFLAQTMDKMTIPALPTRGNEILPANVARATGQTINQNYDSSVNISGPITVQAQDPNGMARMLEQKARMKRLVTR